MRLFLLILTMAVLGGGLAACGVKPEFPTAPGGEETDEYPRTYPTY